MKLHGIYPRLNRVKDPWFSVGLVFEFLILISKVSIGAHGLKPFSLVLIALNSNLLELAQDQNSQKFF